MMGTGIKQTNRKTRSEQMVFILRPLAALDPLGGAISTRRGSKKLLLVGVTAVLCVVAVFLLGRMPFNLPAGIIFDSAVLRSQIARTGLWGVAIMFLLQILQMVIPVIPGLPLQIATGYSYGFVRGLLLNLLSATVGGQIAFVLVRCVGRPVVSQLVPQDAQKRCEQILERGGVIFLVFAYMIPFFPAELMNFVAGLTPIRGRRFFLATLIGRLPLVIITTLVGSHGLELPGMVSF